MNMDKYEITLDRNDFDLLLNALHAVKCMLEPSQTGLDSIKLDLLYSRLVWMKNTAEK